MWIDPSQHVSPEVATGFRPSCRLPPGFPNGDIVDTVVRRYEELFRQPHLVRKSYRTRIIPRREAVIRKGIIKVRFTLRSSSLRILLKTNDRWYLRWRLQHQAAVRSLDDFSFFRVGFARYVEMRERNGILLDVGDDIMINSVLK